MRLDKLLSHTGFGSRKEVKQVLKKADVRVNQVRMKDGKVIVDEATDLITVNGQRLSYQKFYYYMLNKPQGVVSATKDREDKTVLELLSETDYLADLFPVGRLDKDTVGLLLLTNDGDLAHQLLSPKKHVNKEYFAKVQGIVTEEDRELFGRGLILKNGEACLPATLKISKILEAENQSEIFLTIQEGKFHQVKRMFETVDKTVVFLQRTKMGSLQLEQNLKEGSYRALTMEEIESLKKR